MHTYRITLRLATLCLLGAAAISLAALSGEYPGATPAGRRVATRDVLPISLLAWAHLGVLDSRESGRRWWAAVASLGDGALLTIGVSRAWGGAAPLTLAVAAIAVVLLLGTLGVAWSGAEPARDRHHASDSPRS